MSLEKDKKRKPAKSKKARPIRKKKRTRQPMTKGGKILLWSGIMLAVLILTGAIGAGLFFLLREEPVEEIPEPDLTESVEEILQEIEDTDIGDDVVDHIITAGNAVLDSYQKRPQSYELTDANRSNFVTISECIINPENKKISVTATGDGIPKSDDKYYYLFALNTYDTGIADGADYIAREYKDSETVMTAGLNYNMSGSRLYKKFVVAVKLNGKYVQVSTPKYITNPEVIAKYTSVFQQPASKKGLLVDPNKLRGSELDDLGVKQAAYNIPVSRLLGPTSNSAYPTIYYTYNGKTYTLNGQVVAEYDLVFGTLTAKGITTTAIILNNYSSAYPQLIHPDARSGSTAPYYMFNGTEESGVEYMAAIASFLAERYSGNSHGRISNWVIANEINARKEWNYMKYTDIDTYVEEYAKAFRVFYTAIKSVSSSARVYISIDQQWDRNIKNNTNYDGRDILDVFNNNISSKGNIDWGVAQHPYNVPLTEARIWKSSKYVKHNAGTSMITMANIEVLINYMKQDQFLTDDGEVRSILLSEQGYTSHAGEAYQAAAFAYAYYKVEAYDEIDGFLLNRETDAAEEVAQGLAFGLSDAGGRHKQIYNVFKYIDTSQRAEYTDFAKELIGISNWSEIIR
ncbi:MAG: DUF5722 domain-containing protein [Bacillota bacterium]|nr:DUF5722 domain-containing protein [Bacillota bacterium]